MNINYTKVLTAVIVAMCFTHMPVQAADKVLEIADVANVRHISGEISNIDLKRGIIQLKNDINSDTGESRNYRINKDETRVTGPKDKKFLTLDNLQVGQDVVIDIIKGEEDKIVKKIVAKPYLAPGLQQAFGSLVAIDMAAGTLTIQEAPMDDMNKGAMSTFVFDPKGLVLLQDDSIEPVPSLVLKADDSVRVVYVVKDDKKQAQAITLYTADVTKTTVITTTTTTTTP